MRLDPGMHPGRPRVPPRWSAPPFGAAMEASLHEERPMTPPLFDPHRAQHALRCDRTELITLSLHLLDHCHQACAGLEFALMTGDWRGLDAVMQRVRSGCAVLGVASIGERVKALQQRADNRLLRVEDLLSLTEDLRGLTEELLGFVGEARAEPAEPLAMAA